MSGQFFVFKKSIMPAAPNKLNLNFAKNAYSVFGNRDNDRRNENQREQIKELLEGKNIFLKLEFFFFVEINFHC